MLLHSPMEDQKTQSLQKNVKRQRRTCDGRDTQMCRCRHRRRQDSGPSSTACSSRTPLPFALPRLRLPMDSQKVHRSWASLQGIIWQLLACPPNEPRQTLQTRRCRRPRGSRWCPEVRASRTGCPPWHLLKGGRRPRVTWGDEDEEEKPWERSALPHEPT